LVVLIAAALLVAACVEALEETGGQASTTTSDGEPDGRSSTTATFDEPDGESSTTASPGEPVTTGTACAIPEGEAFDAGAPVQLAQLGEVDGVTVSGAIYPHPDYEGNPWSQWGQGIVVDEGRFFSAIGDHRGVDGNSYIYEYDPDANALTMVGDVLSYVDHVPGTWGYGKIHSQMVPGPCGEAYFSTYWGTFRDIEFEGDYSGDVIFRLDPHGRTLRALGVPVEFHGQASLAADPSRGVIYGEAVDPVSKDNGVDRGPFFAYDVVGEELVYMGPEEPHVGFRSVMVDADGVAYYSIGDAELQTYDPATGESVAHDGRLPGEWLRAATAPGPDGSVYGVTVEPDRFLVMRPDGTIDELGEALGYTTSVALSPDGSSLFYMPGGHGNSGDWGSPLIMVDTETGAQTVVVELDEMVEDALGYTVGGTYNLAVGPEGDTIFMGVNAGPVGSDTAFGEVILLLIEMQ
jgi:hypothetical protein